MAWRWFQATCCLFSTPLTDPNLANICVKIDGAYEGELIVRKLHLSMGSDLELPPRFYKVGSCMGLEFRINGLIRMGTTPFTSGRDPLCKHMGVSKK